MFLKRMKSVDTLETTGIAETDEAVDPLENNKKLSFLLTTVEAAEAVDAVESLVGHERVSFTRLYSEVVGLCPGFALFSWCFFSVPLQVRRWSRGLPICGSGFCNDDLR